MSLEKLKLLILDVDGTMTDGGVYVTEEGKQFKKFNAKDGMGIKIAIKNGIEIGIISHSYVTEMVENRAKTLGIKHYYIGQKPKTEVLDEWLNELKITKDEVGFIGDDVNDLEIMQMVGTSICPADAVKEIKKIAQIHLSKNGGDGAVREFIDEYLLK